MNDLFFRVLNFKKFGIEKFVGYVDLNAHPLTLASIAGP